MMFGNYIEPEYHYFFSCIGSKPQFSHVTLQKRIWVQYCVFDLSVLGLMKPWQFVFNGTLTVQYASGLSPTTLYQSFVTCRFAKVEGDPKRQKVFTISNPIGASKPPSFLQRWNTKTFTLEQAIPKEGSLSAIAVSDNGTYVATGSMFDGTVEIYTAFNLQVMLHYLVPIALGFDLTFTAYAWEVLLRH